MIITTVHIACMLLLGFRIMLFGARNRRRPIIATLAYVLMIAALVEAVQLTFGIVPPPSLLSLIPELTLTLAVYCHGGNLAQLFKPEGEKSALSKLLCWSPQKNKVTP